MYKEHLSVVLTFVITREHFFDVSLVAANIASSSKYSTSFVGLQVMKTIS